MIGYKVTDKDGVSFEDLDGFCAQYQWNAGVEYIDSKLISFFQDLFLAVFLAPPESDARIWLVDANDCMANSGVICRAKKVKAIKELDLVGVSKTQMFPEERLCEIYKSFGCKNREEILYRLAIRSISANELIKCLRNR